MREQLTANISIAEITMISVTTCLLQYGVVPASPRALRDHERGHRERQQPEAHEQPALAALAPAAEEATVGGRALKETPL